MTEEQVTKAILAWLIDNDWSIICYDFPQSGTGRFLHPNNSAEKNKDTINPDIVAIKGNICIFFENKSYFYFPDYQKIEMLRTTTKYTDSINDLLKDFQISNIYYGIGYPLKAHKQKAIHSEHLTDFVVGVNADKSITILFESVKIFL